MARVVPLVLVAAVLSGCVGSLEPYETEPGAATRLDGTKAPVQGLSVAEALRLHPQEAVYVRGYLLAPYDDKPRLCTRLSETGKCDGALVLDLSGVELEVGDTLRAGCCSLGLWSPRPLVVRVKLGSGRRALVLG